MEASARRHAPATARNGGPILECLAASLPAGGLVLEVASGTGEHAVRFARALAPIRWQPSDPDPVARASIAAWAAAEALDKVLPPLALDAAAAHWPVDRADAVVCINMTHIAPWAATMGLMRGSAAVLPPGAPLYIYGPFLRAGVETVASNLAFDRSLRARDPAWGLRRLEDVVACAEATGLVLASVSEMPANNLSLLFHRAAHD